MVNDGWQIEFKTIFFDVTINTIRVIDDVTLQINIYNMHSYSLDKKVPKFQTSSVFKHINTLRVKLDVVFIACVFG